MSFSARAGSLAREALDSLWAHPLRSTLTVLSVAFGAAVLHLLLSYATSVPATTASILRSLGSKEFIVEARRQREVRREVLLRLQPDQVPDHLGHGGGRALQQVLAGEQGPVEVARGQLHAPQPSGRNRRRCRLSPGP